VGLLCNDDEARRLISGELLCWLVQMQTLPVDDTATNGWPYMKIGIPVLLNCLALALPSRPVPSDPMNDVREFPIPVCIAMADNSHQSSNSRFRSCHGIDSVHDAHRESSFGISCCFSGDPVSYTNNLTFSFWMHVKRVKDNAIQLLQFDLSFFNTDTAAVTETCLRKVLLDYNITIKGYRMFQSDRLSHKGDAVCLYVRDGL
jgi:hypothetical protein